MSESSPLSDDNLKPRGRSVKAKTMNRNRVEGKMGAGVPKTTENFFKDTRRPLIRSTPLAVLAECPRKFLYEYKLGISSKGYNSAFTMGGIVHQVLQSLAMGYSQEEALAGAKTFITKKQNEITEQAGPNGFLTNGQDLAAIIRKMDEDYHKARAMALVFWSFRPFDPDKWEILQAPDGTKMVETILEVEYPGLNKAMRTPCDLALVKKGTREVWIWDYKTTSFDPKKRAIPTKFSPQLALYRIALQTHLDKWAMEKGYPKYTVVGSLHAILKKPTIKYCPKTKDKDGFHAYINRLIEWYTNKEKDDPKNPPLILDPHRFANKPMTQEMFGRLKEYCKASHAAPNIDHFYRTGESACFNFNQVCPYMQLCNSDSAMWPDIIRNAYQIRFREDDEENPYE